MSPSPTRGLTDPAALAALQRVPLRLRPAAPRRRGSPRARARRAPRAAQEAPEVRRRRRDHLQRAPGRRGRRGHVPARRPLCTVWNRTRPSLLMYINLAAADGLALARNTALSHV